MLDLDESYITCLRDAITELYDGTADLCTITGDQPAPDSLADKEIRESPRPESIISARAMAIQLIEYSGDHLAAFAKILTEPTGSLATWTCVRSMLESCALSAWMTDPSIDHKERVARVFAHRYEGLEQQLKCGRAGLIKPTELERLVLRIDEVEETAITLGYPPIQNTKGKRTGIGRRMPGATEIITLVLDKEKMYRLLSAVAHGHTWAINALGFKPVQAPSNATSIAGIRVKCLEKQVFVIGMAYLGLGAADAFAKALWHLWCYMGWNSAPLSVLFEKVFDQLQAKACNRFWRSVTDAAQPDAGP